MMFKGLMLTLWSIAKPRWDRKVNDARERWRHGLRKENLTWSCACILITALTIYGLWQSTYAAGGLRLGLSFAFAAFLAIVNGYILTHPLRCFLVAIAVMMGSLGISAIMEDGRRAIASGDFSVLVILPVPAYLLWRFQKYLETGDWTWK